MSSTNADDQQTPFQAIVSSAVPESAEQADADDWSADEIELAYQKALQATEALSEELQGNEQMSPGEEAADIGSAADLALEDSGDDLEEEERTSQQRVQPRQIIEALLFVGGEPLTTRIIEDTLGGNFSHEQIDDLINELNAEYASQNRPYEIRFGEGGYRFALTSEYEKVRRKVFGIGPKEVKLSQDALEVLAFIAYKQPVSKEDLTEIGKKNTSGLIRQLIRRELVVLERDEESGAVSYGTARRFLSLFGLGSLEELPRPEQLEIR